LYQVLKCPKIKYKRNNIVKILYSSVPGSGYLFTKGNILRGRGRKGGGGRRGGGGGLPTQLLFFPSLLPEPENHFLRDFESCLSARLHPTCCTSDYFGFLASLTTAIRTKIQQKRKFVSCSNAFSTTIDIETNHNISPPYLRVHTQEHG
jgi:hypothetical protein